MIRLPPTDKDLLDRIEGVTLRRHAGYAVNEGSTVVVSYGPPKVGSTSAREAARRKWDPSMPVYHIHEFGPREQAYAHEPPHKTQAGKALWNVFAEHRESLRWVFMYGVRDPIERHLSECFQDRGDIPAIGAAGILMEPEPAGERHHVEYIRNTGIDIYADNFDKKLGWGTVRRGTVSVLTYKLSSLSSFIEGPLSEELYTRLRSFHLKPEKGGGYAEALSIAKFKETTLRRIYGSKSVTHYYTEDEIEQMIKRWKI